MGANPWKRRQSKMLQIICAIILSPASAVSQTDWLQFLSSSVQHFAFWCISHLPDNCDGIKTIAQWNVKRGGVVDPWVFIATPGGRMGWVGVCLAEQGGGLGWTVPLAYEKTINVSNVKCFPPPRRVKSDLWSVLSPSLQLESTKTIGGMF